MAIRRSHFHSFFVEIDDYALLSLRSLQHAFPDLSRNKVISMAIEKMAIDLPSDYEFVDGVWHRR